MVFIKIEIVQKNIFSNTYLQQKNHLIFVKNLTSVQSLPINVYLYLYLLNLYNIIIQEQVHNTRVDKDTLFLLFGYYVCMAFYQSKCLRIRVTIIIQSINIVRFVCILYIQKRSILLYKMKHSTHKKKVQIDFINNYLKVLGVEILCV